MNSRPFPRFSDKKCILRHALKLGKMNKMANVPLQIDHIGSMHYYTPLSLFINSNTSQKIPYTMRITYAHFTYM